MPNFIFVIDYNVFKQTVVTVTIPTTAAINQPACFNEQKDKEIILVKKNKWLW